MGIFLFFNINLAQQVRKFVVYFISVTMLLWYKSFTIGKPVYVLLSGTAFVRKIQLWVELHSCICKMPVKNLPNLLCQCQTGYSDTELLVPLELTIKCLTGTWLTVPATSMPYLTDLDRACACALQAFVLQNQVVASFGVSHSTSPNWRPVSIQQRMSEADRKVVVLRR